MSFYAIIFYLYVLVCHSYVSRMYLYVIRMSLACTRMSSVCHSYVLVCHPYVIRMWFYHKPVWAARKINMMRSRCFHHVPHCYPLYYWSRYHPSKVFWAWLSFFMMLLFSVLLESFHHSSVDIDRIVSPMGHFEIWMSWWNFNVLTNAEAVCKIRVNFSQLWIFFSCQFWIQSAMARKNDGLLVSKLIYVIIIL